MPKSPATRRVPYSAISWDESTQRYRGTSGKFLSGDAVRGIIDRDIEATGARMVGHGAKLKAGKLALSDFRNVMTVEIRSLHLAEIAAANGGFHNLTQADYGRAGERIRHHLRALDGMVQEIQAEPKLLAGEIPGRRSIEDRLRWQAESGRNTYERARMAGNEAAGFIYVENELEPGVKNCKGCIAATAMGRVHVSKMSVSGDRECGPECKCKQRYYREAA